MLVAFLEQVTSVFYFQHRHVLYRTLSQPKHQLTPSSEFPRLPADPDSRTVAELFSTEKTSEQMAGAGPPACSPMGCGK